MSADHIPSKELLQALKDLSHAYVRLLESARDRITSLGSDCDPVDVMERGDPYLRKAKDAIKAAERAGHETNARQFTGPGYVLDNIRTLATTDSLIDKPTATERIKLIADLCATILSPSLKANEQRGGICGILIEGHRKSTCSLPKGHTGSHWFPNMWNDM